MNKHKQKDCDDDVGHPPKRQRRDDNYRYDNILYQRENVDTKKCVDNNRLAKELILKDATNHHSSKYTSVLKDDDKQPYKLIESLRYDSETEDQCPLKVGYNIYDLIFCGCHVYYLSPHNLYLHSRHNTMIY